SRVAQDFLAQLDVGAFQAHHHGRFKAERFRCRHYAGGHDIAAHDAAEDVDQDGAHVGIAQNNFKAVFHLFRVGAAAHVQEIGGAPASVLNDVHGGHGQPGAVHHAPDVAVQANVVE